MLRTDIDRFKQSIKDCEVQINDYESRIRGLRADINGMKHAMMEPIIEGS